MASRRIRLALINLGKGRRRKRDTISHVAGTKTCYTRSRWTKMLMGVITHLEVETMVVMEGTEATAPALTLTAAVSRGGALRKRLPNGDAVRRST